jgi:hypothetical protein
MATRPHTESESTGSSDSQNDEINEPVVIPQGQSATHFLAGNYCADATNNNKPPGSSGIMKVLT